MTLPLDPSDVHVWYRATASLDDAATGADVSILSADERDRYGRFVFPRDRRDFAAAHALTRRALSAYMDVRPAEWMFDATPEGKPFLPRDRDGAPPPAFNLSHTHGLVACALGRAADIGLDVERVDRGAGEGAIAARYFTPAETAFIEAGAAADRRVRFIELWTLKEAYVKAIGRGLMQPLNEFGFAFEGPRGLRFEPPAGSSADDWAFALFAPLPEARMAVAVRSARGAHRRIVARVDGASGPGLGALRERGPG